MPTHSIELASEWCDRNLTPWLRKGARETRLPPAEARRDGLPPRYSLDELADLIEAAGERIVASLVVECDLEVDDAGRAISAFCDALDDELEARGIESPLWDVTGPRLGDPDDPRQRAARLRVEARVAALQAELAAADA